MLLTYRRINPTPLTEFGNQSAGAPPLSGQAVTRPPRSSPAFLRQTARRFRQTSPEWGMLDETQPALPAPFLPATWIRPRIAAKQAGGFRRKNLSPDFIATLGPGLTARPPFAGTAARPRFTARDFLVRARRYRQTDPRAAMSGQTARTLGSFLGAKLGFLTVQGRRSLTNFQVTPNRTGTFTVQ